jgi:mRNA interferase RelE/StbE
MSKGLAYRIEIERVPEKVMARLPSNTRRRLRQAIDNLATDPRPRGSIKMKGHGDDYYRIRVGDWCIIYFIDDGRLLILVVDVGARGGVYDNW